MIPQQQCEEDRQALLDSTRQLLDRQRIQADAERAGYFCPDLSSEDSYAGSLAVYREALARMLGWPLSEPQVAGSATCRLIGDDELGRIFRVVTHVTPEQNGYGLLFLPNSPGRNPLVMALHGGEGSPELAAGILDGHTANYNAMIRGLRARKIAVFSPQLLVWGNGLKPCFDQYLLDREFRHLGGSRVAWDLRQLQCSFQWLTGHSEIDPDRMAITGLSYGGFYSLYFGALEPRLRAVACSCFVNDRHRYNWEDWVWTGSARRFLDSEVARMVCPRPLFLEAGAEDKVFDVSGFSKPASEVAETYRRLGIPDRCRIRIHPGAHEYDPDGEVENFLLSWL